MKPWNVWTLTLLAVCTLHMQSVSAQRNPLMNATIGELVDVAGANKTYLNFAREVYAAKFLGMLVFIEDPIDNDDELKRREWIYVSEYNNINVRHIQSGLRLLKFFGHMISKLTLHYRQPTSTGDPRELNDYINFYCSDTLRYFRPWNRDAKYEHLFAGMNKPFRVLETLVLDGAYKTLSSASLSFPELFPTRHIIFMPYELVDTESLDQVFPDLEHLEITANPRHLPHSVVEKLLRKNTHINELTMYYSNPEFLEKVHDIFGKESSFLEKLALKSFQPNHQGGGRDLVFKNVTSFELEIADASKPPPMNIYFDHLIEFTIDLNNIEHKKHEFIPLVQRNPNLEKFFMKTRSNGFIDNEQLEQFMALGLKLKEVRLQLAYVHSLSVIEFAKRNVGRANRIELVSNRYVDKDMIRGLMQHFVDLFGRDFHVSNVDGGLLIERRHFV